MFAKNLHSFRNALMQQDMRKNFFAGLSQSLVYVFELRTATLADISKSFPVPHHTLLKEQLIQV